MIFDSEMLRYGCVLTSAVNLLKNIIVINHTLAT